MAKAHWKHLLTLSNRRLLRLMRNGITKDVRCMAYGILVNRGYFYRGAK